MKIEKRPLYMKNLISFTKEIHPSDWEKGLTTLEVLELEDGLYQTGPLFFSIKDVPDNEEKAFTFYMPINWTTEFPPELTTVAFIDELSIDEAVLLRQADNEDNFLSARKLIDKYAEEEQLILDEETFVVCIEAYGEYILDIYVPIKDVI
ncbi:DUF5085 family protein [Enterococcus rivorum]|uniref:DUF5085 domain-containing protein n=1 Tax=Enterococcus rivorum TaxID=762845 RepID=A0A1E5KT90_9ENTE|nr:DUF5085 family protein [Enterococcus rivorum]MBP2099103.1 hypothetical protein [Enterococcus rivorum]OEH81105.1 hypothetical protein BCR26_17705 [Enterococcus rivorum]